MQAGRATPRPLQAAVCNSLLALSKCWLPHSDACASTRRCIRNGPGILWPEEDTIEALAEIGGGRVGEEEGQGGGVVGGKGGPVHKIG
jgi:hypothetical protein